MEEFYQIFKQYPADIKLALNIYARKVVVHNPTQKDKINIHKALTTFSDYWNIYGNEINDINYLSCLATVFVDEMLFCTEYGEVCLAIKRLMEKDQKNMFTSSTEM